MRQNLLFIKTTFNWIVVSTILVFISAALFILALNNYLLFHTIAEIFSVVVSVGIYILASRTYRYSGNNHLLFIGYTFLFLSILTLLHLTSYYGMGIFKNMTPDEPTQFWIASKYMQSICILISPLFIKHKLPRIPVFLAFIITTTSIIASILWFKVFPACFVDEKGLSNFKIVSEYLISFIFLLSIINIYSRRKSINIHVCTLLSVSIFLIIISEISFTLYKTPYGIQNIIGHIFAAASYCLMYWSIVLRGIENPYQELSVAYNKTIIGLTKVLELRDLETKGHSERVTNMTIRLARAYGIKNKELTNILRGAILHDIGKIGVPDSILLKKGPLNDEEWVIMRKHVEYSYELLSSIDYLKDAIDIPYCHHEKWDGTGYPRGLKGEEIPIGARIFAIVDVWDALTSKRPYRNAWSKKAVLEHISSLSGSHFDPRIVDLFLAVNSETPSLYTASSDLIPFEEISYPKQLSGL